jgi:asparagine synthase (glutamine-hydrolysing)
MCGIVGFATRDPLAPADLADVERMVRTLVHRGPDEEGTVACAGAGLGMRRLSIVDLAGGQQPFWNEDHTVVVVGNGEIYNFAEVRARLEARGHRFRSHSDIEVAVHAYEEYGEDCVSHLKGMFALAWWDTRTATLLAARDRAGEKPLFYAETPQGLFLASEVKALLTRPEVSREIDLEAVDQFLTYEYVIAPRSMLKAVRKLPAAHMLTYSRGELRVRRYWDAADIPVRPWREDEAVEAVRSAFARAVDSQMMADVPLGVFLSGGVDSSAIVAEMSRAAVRRGVRVSSFSLGFDDGSYNELPYAREVAARFGTDHHEDIVRPDVAHLFEPLVTHLDEPFADVSLFPTYLVSRLAQRHVKVVLGGDGGDELFGGYDAYVAQRLAARMQGVTPRLVWRLAEQAASLVRPQAKKKGAINKAKRFIEGMASGDPGIGHYRWMTFLGPRSRSRLYRPALADALRASDVHREVREAIGAYQADDPINRALYADLRIYLADDILQKVDRMSMATSLETRAPFLDTDLMELVFSMPGSLKVRGGERKYVLKQALRGVVPDSILTRRKEGFSIPMKQWLRRELQPLMRDLLSPERIGRRGLFVPAEVTRLIDSHVAGRANYAHQLFSLMVLERWIEHVAG